MLQQKLCVVFARSSLKKKKLQGLTSIIISASVQISVSHSKGRTIMCASTSQTWAYTASFFFSFIKSIMDNFLL